jgi:hypothetical protein
MSVASTIQTVPTARLPRLFQFALALALAAGLVRGLAVPAHAQPPNNNSPSSSQIAVPILNYLANNDICETWLEVQNIGDEFTRAALVVWGAPAFCPRCPPAPRAASSSSSRAAALGVGLDRRSSASTTSWPTSCARPCSSASSATRTTSAASRRPTTRAGLRRHPHGHRGRRGLRSPWTCPARLPRRPDGRRAGDLGKYNGIEATTWAPTTRLRRLRVLHPARVRRQGRLQQLALHPERRPRVLVVEIWFKDQDECLRARICEVFTLAPGETLQFDPNDCVSQFQGSAWVRASQPLGIAVDIVGRDVLMTYTGEPESTTRTILQRRHFHAGQPGRLRAARLQRVPGLGLRRSRCRTCRRWSPPRSRSTSWTAAATSSRRCRLDLPARQPDVLPARRLRPARQLGRQRPRREPGVVHAGRPARRTRREHPVRGPDLIKYADRQRTTRARPWPTTSCPRSSFDWQLGSGNGGTGAARPHRHAARGQGSAGPRRHDRAGDHEPRAQAGLHRLRDLHLRPERLIDYVCQKLNEKQVEYIDLAPGAPSNRGFKGSAVMSATFWEHDVFDDEGNFVRNLVTISRSMAPRGRLCRPRGGSSLIPISILFAIGTSPGDPQAASPAPSTARGSAC